MGTSRDGESIVIDLRQITYLMKKSILWILLAALAGGIFGYAKASRDFPAYYIADVDFLVYSRQGEMLFPDKNEEEEMVVSEETPEEVLINTYTSVIISDSVLQQVIDELRLDWSLSRLRSAITIESEKGSRIMNVAVRASRWASEPSGPLEKPPCRAAPFVITGANMPLWAQRSSRLLCSFCWS